MSYAYTPGLKVKNATIVRKSRILPSHGRVLVNKGDYVSHDTVVAETFVPGDVTLTNMAIALGVTPEEIDKYMLKKVGDTVKKGETLGISTSFFGLFKSVAKSDADGTIELISNVTGAIGIRGPPVPVGLNAYIPGKISQVYPEIGCVIETPAAYIQGIFGIGGETQGELMNIARQNEVITPDLINHECAGKILTGGCIVTTEALKKAVEEKVKGVMVGGINSQALTDLMGYQIGVAITGREETNITIIITEGFGKMEMAKPTFELLKSLEGNQASMDGATQIRAGVIRPEIIVPLKETNSASFSQEIQDQEEGIAINTKVRIIRKPYFGRIGLVSSLPSIPQKIETESHVRVLEVELNNGKKVIVPRANVEILEE